MKMEHEKLSWDRTVSAAESLKMMTPSDREEQRRSFAAGNAGMSNPAVTRELVDRVADEMGKTGWTIESAFEQLESCGYECPGGKLENNDAYVFLRGEAARLEAIPTYSYQTVRGLVDWRDKEIAELKAEIFQLQSLNSDVAAHLAALEEHRLCGGGDAAASGTET